MSDHFMGTSPNHGTAGHRLAQRSDQGRNRCGVSHTPSDQGRNRPDEPDTPSDQGRNRYGPKTGSQRFPNLRNLYGTAGQRPGTARNRFPSLAVPGFPSIDGNRGPDRHLRGFLAPSRNRSRRPMLTTMGLIGFDPAESVEAPSGTRGFDSPQVHENTRHKGR